jgi:hypothetical protein
VALNDVAVKERLEETKLLSKAPVPDGTAAIQRTAKWFDRGVRSYNIARGVLVVADLRQSTIATVGALLRWCRRARWERGF